MATYEEKPKKCQMRRDKKASKFQGGRSGGNIECAQSTFIQIVLVKSGSPTKQGSKYWVCRGTPDIPASAAPEFFII